MPNVYQHLDNVLWFNICGNWRDEKGNKYSITLDEGRCSCSVLTERVNGSVQKTTGLITIPQKIEWGQNYILRTPVNGLFKESEKPGQLLWQPKRAKMKAYLWTRRTPEA